MIQKNFFLSYVSRIALATTLGDLIFGYDTAVVRKTVKGIGEFLDNPLSRDTKLVKDVIINYPITLLNKLYLPLYRKRRRLCVYQSTQYLGECIDREYNSNFLHPRPFYS